MARKNWKRLAKDLAPFLAIWAERYREDYGLNGMHPVHYDLLAQTGCRMVDFKRATNAPNQEADVCR